MFGNGHIKVNNFHIVSLDTFAKTAEIFTLILNSWRVNTHVILSQIIELKELGKIQIFLEK